MYSLYRWSAHIYQTVPSSYLTFDLLFAISATCTTRDPLGGFEIQGFLCGNEKCVPLAAFCDNIDHCGDMSDELPCKTSKYHKLCKKLKFLVTREDNEVSVHVMYSYICWLLPKHTSKAKTFYLMSLHFGFMNNKYMCACLKKTRYILEPYARLKEYHSRARDNVGDCLG